MQRTTSEGSVTTGDSLLDRKPTTGDSLLDRKSTTGDSLLDRKSTSGVLGLPEHFDVSSEEEEALTVFENRCAGFVNGILGGLSKEPEEATSTVLTGLATSWQIGDEDVLSKLGALVKGTVAEGNVPQVMADAAGIVQEAGPVEGIGTSIFFKLAESQREAMAGSSQDSWRGGARQRGGGDEEERAIDVAAGAVGAAVGAEVTQPVREMTAAVRAQASPVVADSVKLSVAAMSAMDSEGWNSAQANAEAAAAPRVPPGDNVRLAVAGVGGIGGENMGAIMSALQAVGGGLRCGLRESGTAVVGGGAAIMRAIRNRVRQLDGATVYDARRRMAAFTAGVVALGTWAADYWGPGNVARSTCMTLLTPFMTRYGAGPWCGVEVQPQGMFHAAQQFAANLAPGGAVWESLGIFMISTTERYDIAARAVCDTVTALVVIMFGSWTGFISAVVSPIRIAAGNSLGALNKYFTGELTAKETLREQLLSTYDAFITAWTTSNGNNEDDFIACLALARALGASPVDLEAGRSIFIRFGIPVPKFFFGDGNPPVPKFGPNNETAESLRIFLTTDEVAQAIRELPASAEQLFVGSDGAKRKYMLLRNLLQLAAVTAVALTRAQEQQPAMTDDTQRRLQVEFQRTMETYRNMRINSLLAAEDLAVAFATNVGNALMPRQGAAPRQEGGGRRTRRSKPRSRARRKGNKRKTRVGKRRRTRKH